MLIVIYVEFMKGKFCVTKGVAGFIAENEEEIYHLLTQEVMAKKSA